MIAVLFSFSSFTDFLQVFWFGWSCFVLFSDKISQTWRKLALACRYLTAII